MAIAGIILSAPDGALVGLEAAVRDRKGVVDVQRTPADAEIRGLVLVVEQTSDVIQKELGALRELPGVEDLHLVFANYEDDMDSQEHMVCPAHEPHRHASGDDAARKNGERA